MTNKSPEARRIMLAVTETSSLPDLWGAVLQHLAGESGELVTVFISDDRWRRAASLPFTREISRASGGSINFTVTRAEQVGRDLAGRTQSFLQKLATEAKIQFAFEILAEQETARIHEFVTSESDVLIAPSFFRGRPIYDEIERLKCRFFLVDVSSAEAQEESL